MKIWKWVFFSLQAEGRGFSRNPTGSTPTSNLEEIRGFFVFYKFGGSPVFLRDQLPHRVPNLFGIFLCLPSSKKWALAAGRGFSRNSTGSTPTSNPEEIRDFFCLKKFKKSVGPYYQRKKNYNSERFSRSFKSFERPLIFLFLRRSFK